MGIEAIYLASSGERITRLDQLQDIDELHVVEGAGPHGGQPSAASPSAGGGNGYLQSSPSSQQQQPYGSGRVGVAVADDGALTPSNSGGRPDTDGDQAAKYAKRQGSLQRTMKRVFPSLFQNSLPLTTRCVAVSVVEVVEVVGYMQGEE